MVRHVPTTRPPRPNQDQIPLVKSAERTVRILETLAASSRRLTISELQERVGYPRSSLHALVRTLRDLKWVEADEAGLAFSVGPHALLSGTAYPGQGPRAALRLRHAGGPARRARVHDPLRAPRRGPRAVSGQSRAPRRGAHRLAGRPASARVPDRAGSSAARGADRRGGRRRPAAGAGTVHRKHDHRPRRVARRAGCRAWTGLGLRTRTRYAGGSVCRD